MIYHKDVSILPSPYLEIEASDTNVNKQESSGYGLYFGSLAEWKGIRILVEALKTVIKAKPKFRFLFIGRDLGTIDNCIPSEYIANQLCDHMKNVKIIGNQNQRSLYRFIHGSLFCCFPTLADNFPNAVLDAMSCSKCIISTRGRGVDEQIIDGESGILVAPESTLELSAAIIDVINMTSEERDTYGRKAKDSLERFSPRVCAAQLVEAYKQIIAE
jgi:glycosyltransferase involved in cell wall biosynthesis